MASATILGACNLVTVREAKRVGPEALALRREREAKSLAGFRAGVAARVRTMVEAHAWLWGEHGCYAAGSVIQARKAPAVKDAALLKSY